MASGDGPGDRQPQTGMAAAIGSAPEAQEDLLLLLGGDAGPLIDHGHLHLTTTRRDLHAHRAALRAVTDGVVQQVGEQAQQLLAVGCGVLQAMSDGCSL